MMKTLSIIVCYLLTINSYSQEIIFDWNIILGNTGRTTGLSIECDTSGFIYTAGTFEGTINYNGTTITAAGGKDGYLFKLDSIGNLLWSKQFSSNNDVIITSLTIDNENNLILLGDYRVSVSFDTNMTTNNTDTLVSSNMFIAKYSINGDLLWGKNTGGVSWRGNSISVDLNNDILITGKSIDINFFDTTLPITTIDSIWVGTPDSSWWQYFHPEEGFLAKYSSNGNIIWIIKAGDYPQDVISDNLNNIVVTGHTGNAYFGDTLIVNPAPSYLAQFSSDGVLNWIKFSGGSANNNSGTGLDVDTSNNIYQCGTLLGNNIVFDGIIVLPFSSLNAFLTKYDVSGNLIWYKLINPPPPPNWASPNSGEALKIDDNGDILLLGIFDGILSFDTITLVSTGEEAFDLMLLKYNPDGINIGASQFTQLGWVHGYDLTIDTNKDIYITGATSINGNSSLDPHYSFIGKIDETIPTSPLSIEENFETYNLSIYPNPSEGDLYIEFSESIPEKKIEIFSIDGRKIKEITTLESNTFFEIKGSGIYLIVITFDDKVITKKVIIE